MRRHRATTLRDFGTIVVMIAVAVVVIALPVAYVASKQDIICTVTEKDRTSKVVDGNSSVDTRIFTSDCGVLSLNDSIIGLSFDTADKYNSIKTGETYKFTTIGWRVPFFSMFPNIVEVQAV